MADRISTLDPAYQPGMLSIFPEAIDTKSTLYEVRNDAQTFLTQTVTYSGKFLVVNDASAFPPEGLIRVGTELMYYRSRTNTVFNNLKRGFAGSRRDGWTTGTIVGNAVMAETHNALKDAILNIEKDLGIFGATDSVSLNGILSNLEIKYLAPQAKFRVFPLAGPPPLTVQFQNFSGGSPIRFFWNFGDGVTSVDTSPSHVYQKEGTYTVSLQIITSLGGQGIATKNNYITVSSNDRLPLFYVEPITGKSVATAGTNATVFNFVDQTDGNITSRYWIWDDGTNTAETDPDIHSENHVYQNPGTYQPVLLCVFADSSLKRIVYNGVIVVL